MTPQGALQGAGETDKKMQVIVESYTLQCIIGTVQGAGESGINYQLQVESYTSFIIGGGETGINFWTGGSGNR